MVREGEVLHIPADAPHQAEALEDTFQLDVFSPPREDWLRDADWTTSVQAGLKVCLSVIGAQRPASGA